MYDFRIRIVSFLLSCVVLIACVPDEDSHKKQIVTSFTVIADIARNVAGQAANVHSITKPGADVHDYQPTPQDIIKAKKADLILWNGLNLERWFERFLQDVSAPGVVVTQGIKPLSIYAGPYSGKPNPHAWMSIDNALIYVENIRIALINVDPDNADIYNQNAQKYSEDIKHIQQTLQDNLAEVAQERRYLATSEGAFSYLAHDFEMENISIWPVNADQQGTPQQVRRVIDAIKLHNIPVIFSESTVSDKPAKQIAKDTNILYGGVLYVDSLSDEDGDVPTYLDLLRTTSHRVSDGFRRALALEEQAQTQ